MSHGKLRDIHFNYYLFIIIYSPGQNRMSRRNSHELKQSKSQNITKQS